jgi:hypothetical protein
MPWDASKHRAFGGGLPALHPLRAAAAAGHPPALRIRPTGPFGHAPRIFGFGGAVPGFEDGGTTPGDYQPGSLSPMMANQVSHYSSLSPEALQEAAVRLRGTQQGQIAQRLLMQRRILNAQQPAQSQAQPEQQPPPMGFASGGTLHGLPKPYALGGMLAPEGGVHMAERGLNESGFLHTAGPGRGDNIGITPKMQSYVLPADVISGAGQGNSLSGAKALEGTLSGKIGPYGMPMHQPRGRHTMPSPPPAYHDPDQNWAEHLAGGTRGAMARGGTANRTPVEVAGGEFILSPEDVARVGAHYGGDITHGHAVLDAYVKHRRKQTIRDLKGLKGPVQ